MKSSSSFLIILSLLAGTACSSKTTSDSCSVTDFAGTTLSNFGSAGVNPNVVSVTVNGSTCGTGTSYPNKPCVAVTICSPSQPTQCQTINNILLDTGSFGLRIFGSVITVPLSPITNGNSNLAECVQFGDGSSEWGPVEYAYVQLGNESLVGVPIHVINYSYGSPPDPCTESQSYPDKTPDDTGFNGILGVGLFAQDCGNDCITDSNNGQYYSCSGSSCSCGATVALAAQVANPVPQIPTDNNGVVLQLPAVGSTSGASSVAGTLYLGIGTRANNVPSGVTTFSADANGNMKTAFSAYNSASMLSFIDSGSNASYFPAPTGGQLPDCGSTHGSLWQGLFCPTSVQSLSAVNYGSSGSPNGTVSFQIENAYSLINSSQNVFNDFGGNTLSTSGSTPYFDWGLPFFFGRNVYVGIQGATSSLGSGPYWAY